MIRAQPMGLWETKEGVQQARRELSEMEHRFQSVVRRQRLAVQNSDLKDDPLSKQASLKPAPYLPQRDVLHGKSEGEPRSTEQAPLDGYEADLAAGDVDSALEGDCVGKGATRPPPLNSGRLPLPWTGRLGYVSALQQ